MSEADKLFEELGYYKVDTKIKGITNYINIYGYGFRINDLDKVVGVINLKSITLHELKAINKKVEELGWN